MVREIWFAYRTGLRSRSGPRQGWFHKSRRVAGEHRSHKERFGINDIEQSEPTQFLKVGEVIRGTDFKIAKFTEKSERNQYGINEDVSELLLEHPNSPAQVTLVKGKVATSPQSVATFVYTWSGRREFEVRKDQEFPIAAAEGNRTYKLIDVQSNRAVIASTEKPNEPIEIGFAPP